MHLLYLLSVWWLPKLYVNCMLYRNITLCYMPSFWRKHTKSLPFNQMHSDRAQCFLVSFVYHIFYTRRRDVFVSVCVCAIVWFFCPRPSLQQLHTQCWHGVIVSGIVEFCGFAIRFTNHHIGTDLLQVYPRVFDNFMACFVARPSGNLLGHHL